jgi:LPXTG-site transpeptidase (sortase) family protein
MNSCGETMDHEIGAKKPGDNHSSQWQWIPLIAIFVILLFGFGYLPLTDTEVAAQAVPDLSIKKNPLGDFLIGETGVYSITVSNTSSVVVSGTITVTDILPDALSDVEVTAAGWQECGQILQTQIVTCVYSNTTGLAAGDKLPDILISAFVNPITTTQIINTASVTNTNDTDPSNNIASSPTNIVGADLSVSKTLAPASPSEGSVITYTLNVTNLGPSEATGVVLTDTLPVGITFQSSQASQGAYNNVTGLWTVGTLADGSAATLRLRAIVESGTLGQTIVNTAEGLKSVVNDYDLANNVASAGFTIQSTSISGLVKDAATDNPISGAKVELQDSANKLFTMNTDPNGWYTFTNTITTPISAGSATIRASKTGYLSRSATPFLLAGQNTRQDFSLDTVDLLFTKSDGLTTVIPGQTITYTMVISNVGTIPATSVAITDVLPSALTFITDTLGVTRTNPAALTYVWKLKDDIDPGKAVRFKMRVRVADSLPSPATAITNQARTTTRSPEANTSNNIAQDTTTSTGTPNPSISISVSPNQIRINQNATYTIIVKNTGTAPMTDVVVEDTFSTLLDITNATTTKGTATRNNTTRLVTVTISRIDPDEEVTIKVVTRASSNPTTNTTITNSAKLTYKFGGSTFTRTSSSVSLQILVTTTLPGTGGVELGVQSSGSKPYLLAFSSAVLLFLLSLIAFGYAFRNRGEREWSSWAAKMGVMLVVAALLFGAAGGLLLEYSRPGSQSSVAQLYTAPDTGENEPVAKDTEPHTLVWPGVTPQIPGSELDQLPDFPIPTPTLSSASSGSESDLDLTPVNRVIIPAIALDTIVKYVPFDGITWLIAGLKQEVAWMGDTSWPGLGSNTALAGHVTLRDGSNGPFRYIYDLGYGDAVFVYTEQFIYEYKVSNQLTVEATDLSVVGATNESQLTLITCSDWDVNTGFYTKRYIVHADLIGAMPNNHPPQGN